MEAENSRCTVLWADLSILDDRFESVLAEGELRRAARYLRTEDRSRFVLGAALLRFAAGACIGIEPIRVEIERSCQWCAAPHGKPRLVGRGREWHVSVTHSGSLAGVAITRSGAVGLDVEFAVDRDYQPLLESVLSADEAPPESRFAFLTYWTRKESVLKATGAGLTRPMGDVVVSAPSAAPRLISYSGRSAGATMFDLSPATGYVAALTVFSTGPVWVDQQQVSELPLDRSSYMHSDAP